MVDSVEEVGGFRRNFHICDFDSWNIVGIGTKAVAMRQQRHNQGEDNQVIETPHSPGRNWDDWILAVLQFSGLDVTFGSQLTQAFIRFCTTPLC
ncbi:hypothetical protein J6590_004320 [Homalodisca vitripennis]|nr:hypothetical protein J6590_004320 [Homalodisca vitripennis]